jgi:hypothetical protein
MLEWQNYIDKQGNFLLPLYLYKVNTDLMKNTLDLGTLLSSDPTKKRAFKEQVKKIFKKRWLEMAEALEFFGIIERCACEMDEFCEECRGARYLINKAITPKAIREIAFVYGSQADVDVANKLRKAMTQLLEEQIIDDVPVP